VVPAEFDDRTIMELELRKHYGLTLLAVAKEDKFEINPSPVLRLQKGWIMVVIGSNRGIEQLPV
jgi:trk system potassium uptake protein TrkA